MRLRFLDKYLELGRIPAFFIINLEHLSSFESLVSWSNYKVYCKTITDMVKDGVLEVKNERN